jgi:hypothetical protein
LTGWLLPGGERVPMARFDPGMLMLEYSA